MSAGTAFAYDGDYVDVDIDEIGAPSRWSSRGPDNAGEEACSCGFYLSWPPETTEEDRTTMLRLWGEHEASCTGPDASILLHPSLMVCVRCESADVVVLGDPGAPAALRCEPCGHVVAVAELVKVRQLIRSAPPEAVVEHLRRIGAGS